MRARSAARAVRVTVLGNPDRYLAPLSGGSSYLVEAGGARVLLDCGGGAAAALAAANFEGTFDAVVLSHFHFDHVLDLPMIRDVFGPGTTFFIPQGERARLDALAEAYVFRGEKTLAEAASGLAPAAKYDLPGTVVEVAQGTAATVGPLSFTFARSRHSAPSFATRIAHAARAFVYASDTAPCDSVAELARDADLLLAHTLLPTVEPDSNHAQVHTTAQTAATLALASGARRLLLSHRYWESVDAAMLEAASAHENVTLASHGETIDV